MRKAIPVVGTFLAFAFILVGTSWISRSFWVISPPPGALPGWLVSRIEMKDFDIFHAGCALISAGLTFLWFRTEFSDGFRTFDAA
jgi:hypothetical protein